MTDDLTNEVPENLPQPHHSLEAGGAVAALIPRTGAELKKMADALAKSGDMIPYQFQGKPAMVAAAIMRGMEIGLAPMQALSNIAVINGRASLWGDALPALMLRHGHQIDVEVEGEGDDMVATATLTRGDTGQQIVRTFSVNDAKRANLWQTEPKVRRKNKRTGDWYDADNDSPWFRYPKRMLSARARAWAVRDGAADALMGLQIAEEMQDAPKVKDITPRKEADTGFARMAEKAREAAAAAPAEEPADDPASDIIEGEAEVVEEAEVVDGVSPDDLVMAETTGRDMAMEGATRDANPFDEGPERDAWFAGFDAFEALGEEGDDE